MWKITPSSDRHIEGPAGALIAIVDCPGNPRAMAEFIVNRLNLDVGNAVRPAGYVVSKAAEDEHLKDIAAAAKPGPIRKVYTPQTISHDRDCPAYMVGNDPIHGKCICGADYQPPEYGAEPADGQIKRGNDGLPE